MRIGYSFWGFLGPGVVDTPDGGRSHRRTLIDGLRGVSSGDTPSGHDVVFLQANRDLEEAGLDLRSTYAWDDGIPDIDALFLEWRWPIPGRNTTPCETEGHTCDLHRQADLVRHYSIERRTPTILWDKDRRLPCDDPLRVRANVTVCEPALHPSPGARRLLFPVADAALDEADPEALAAIPRSWPLSYVGNQYDRDEAFGRYFAPAALRLAHRVAGKWTQTDAWPHVLFTGRCAFDDVDRIYRDSLCTVLLLPERYASVGHMTQRIFEAVLAGCLPLTPSTIREAASFAPSRLHVHGADDVVSTVQHLRTLEGTGEHATLIASCLERLDLFRASRQVETIIDVFSAVSATTGGPR